MLRIRYRLSPGLPRRRFGGWKNRDGLEAGRPFPGNDMAFDALRMMVNLNRLEDAAGAVAYLSLAFNTLVDRLGGKRVRQSLRKGMSVFKNTICIIHIILHY